MKNINRWLVPVIALCAIAAGAFAAAPVLHSKYKNIGDITVSVQYSDSLKTQDSLVTVICTDTAFVELVVTGWAQMDPNDRLYVGFGVDSTGTKAGTAECNLDTMQMNSPRSGAWVPFCFRYVKAPLLTQTDYTATYTVYFACGGGGTTESVPLKDVVFTATVKDDD